VTLAFVALFIIAYSFPGLLSIVTVLFFVGLGLVVFDAILLFKQKGVWASRVLPEKLSNGDENPIDIKLANNYNFTVKLHLIDELPFQYQKRDFEIKTVLKASDKKNIRYTLRPLERGEYYFGHLNVYAITPIGLIMRRFQFAKDAMVPNYPSFLQLRKYMLMAFSNKLLEYGLKKIRRIGHTMEFEQIENVA
jgi:uncharacterized protein (DUF58 family)